jgi:hypothetical protein
MEGNHFLIVHDEARVGVGAERGGIGSDELGPEETVEVTIQELAIGSHWRHRATEV